jgi:hypothetical protein
VYSSIPSPCHQPAALIRRDLIFLDRALDGGLCVQSIVDVRPAGRVRLPDLQS